MKDDLLKQYQTIKSAEYQFESQILSASLVYNQFYKQYVKFKYLKRIVHPKMNILSSCVLSKR